MKTLANADLGGGWSLTLFEEVASTNTTLVERARTGAGEGIAISAEHQFAGKGRLGRNWQDAPGNSVILSVLVRPEFPVSDYFAITCAMSVAALDALATLGIEAEIKWPNDLLVSGEKISGILAEAGESPTSRFVVVGVGLNVNQAESELMALGRPATSVRVVTGHMLGYEQRQNLRIELLNRFRQGYEALSDSFAQGFSALLRRYREACTTLDSFVRVELTDGEVVTGHVLDISNQGMLMVELDSCIRSISAGDVEHLYR